MNSMQCLYTRGHKGQATTMLISALLRTENGTNLMIDLSLQQLPTLLSVLSESVMVKPQVTFLNIEKSLFLIPPVSLL